MEVVSRCYFVIIITLIYSILLAPSISSCEAKQKPDTHPSSVEESLRHFLQTLDSDKTTRYIAAFRDLNGDGTPEVLVYMLGDSWCGSGGCSLLVLKQNGSSWRIITETTVTQPPIRVLATTYHGWHNIGVWVQGGGVQPGYEAELRFNGRTYPRNPTVPPARRLKENITGEVVIPSKQNAVSLNDD
ncbi:MAG: hypothetical protein ABSA46_17120 [Thermodesulfovibrionales bacterium]|jgi:hypothetical protein